jgi:hypothetical protein
VIDWTERGTIQKEMRREVKNMLMTKGVHADQVEPLAREILNLTRIYFKEL